MTGTAIWLPRDPQATAPLAGIRVLDFSELLPGPFLTQSLVELGADVLKVERPPHGDNVRRVGPALFAAVNRGKRSLLVDLKDPAQRETVLALADTADVLIEGYRPGVMARLGLAWETLSARNPRLVMLSISGYGASGPRAQWPGHDINYLAAAGIVAMAVKPGQDSPSFGVPVADLGAAVYALAALNAALLQRERDGRGQWLDVAMADCALHWMNARLPALREQPGADFETRRQPLVQRPGYGVFRCRDGLLLSIGALEDHFWRGLADTLGLQAYQGEDHRLYRQRSAVAGAINAAVQAALLQLDRAEAMQRLVAADVPVAEALLPDELPTHPQFAERGLFTATDSGPLVRFPVQLRGMAPAPARAPGLGEHGG